MLLGKWENYEQIEESLTLDELEAMVTAMRERDHRNMRFMAALKGIDIDEGETTDLAAGARARAKGRLEGKSQEQVEFEEIGIGFNFIDYGDE